MRRVLFPLLLLLFAANFICNAQTKKAIMEDSVLDAPQYAVYFTDKNGKRKSGWIAASIVGLKR